jgi:hypothetical protein
MSVHPALAIGAVAGGPGTDRGWSQAVKDLGRRVMAVRDGVESPLAVNVVYQIPGEFLDPDFEGVRTGRFSRKEARLLVQVALPRKAGSESTAEVRRLLRDAIAAAEEFARQEGMIEGQLTELWELAERL